MADSNIKKNCSTALKYYAYIWDDKHHTGTTGVGQWKYKGVSCVNTSLC